MYQRAVFYCLQKKLEEVSNDAVAGRQGRRKTVSGKIRAPVSKPAISPKKSLGGRGGRGGRERYKA